MTKRDKNDYIKTAAELRAFVLGHLVKDEYFLKLCGDACRLKFSSYVFLKQLSNRKFWYAKVSIQISDREEINKACIFLRKVIDDYGMLECI